MKKNKTRKTFILLEFFKDKPYISEKLKNFFQSEKGPQDQI